MTENTRENLPGSRPGLPVIEVANAIVALLFAASAPVAIILGAGVSGGLSQADLASWIFAAFAVNGVLTIGMSIAYRQPLAFFWTIPGTVLVGNALDHLSFEQVIGAYLLTALLLFVLGITGWVKAAMDRIPMPIVMGMVSGVFLSFGLNWIRSFEGNFLLVSIMTATFVFFSVIPGSLRRFPPMIGVLVAGMIVLFVQGNIPDLGSATTASALIAPTLYVPDFSWAATLELVVPLAVTVIAAQNAQGIAILRAAGHNPPVSAITTACGGMSVVTAWFGCVSTCLTGPSNAILVSGGERNRHWQAAVLLGVLAIIFGIFSPLVTSLLLATPTAFMSTLAGLALLRILQSAFQASFGQRFSLGALIAFLVTIGAPAIWGIGAPFWGLVFGIATSLLMERDDFAVRSTP